MRITMHGVRKGFVNMFARKPGATEGRVIRVEEDLVSTWIRHAQPIILARDRRCVEHAGDGLLTLLLAQEREHTLFRVVQIYPAEPAGVAITRMKLRMDSIEMRQLAVEVLETAMIAVRQQRPVELLLFAPFMPLPELRAHEHEFLARMRRHVRHEQPVVC